jgi:hypothetical protein
MIDREQWREAPGIGIRKQFRAPVVQDQPVVVEMRGKHGTWEILRLRPRKTAILK